MPIVMLLGPTAAGKTDAAIAMAERLDCYLINMDSTQVYRGLDIGSAKPPRWLLARHPHVFCYFRETSEIDTAADVGTDADREVRVALAAGKTPVLVGGTMLYARAFRDGLAALPRANPEVRSAIEAEAESQGWPKLHARLAKVDPVAAAGIHPHNGVRVQRALEVFETTGRPISDYWKAQKQSPATERLGGRLLEFAVIPEDRATLHHRIEARFDAMLRAGFAEEVQRLRQRPDLSPRLPALRAVGYRQMWDHLEGEFEASEMRAKALAATRQLARRQLTWLRGWPFVKVLPSAEGAAATASAAIAVD
ncbi:MAG: tRNA (adenosine(37)-N6)-dimethylallyltransferase MiaA [Gammaproteobacteria bacterium]|nr:tRNA (adenosine(37)-N6)-dimethylallyltransferase MiaA [Gammaproteobacteria bacterium]